MKPCPLAISVINSDSTDVLSLPNLKYFTILNTYTYLNYLYCLIEVAPFELYQHNYAVLPSHNQACMISRNGTIKIQGGGRQLIQGAK